MSQEGQLESPNWVGFDATSGFRVGLQTVLNRRCGRR